MWQITIDKEKSVGHKSQITMSQHIQFYPQGISEYWEKEGKHYFKNKQGTQLLVEAYTNDIIRLRFAVDGIFEDDFSYAIYSKFEKESPLVKVVEKDDQFVLSTDTTVLRINKADFRQTFEDRQGNLLNEDEKGFHWEEHYKKGGNIVMMSKRAQVGEHFFGLGDKPSNLNLRGKRLVNWGTDQYGYAKDQDPLYKNIPFYIGLHKDRAYGIFFDNTFKSWFDFASERKSVTSFWADGGEMNYYFINGPTLMEVTQKYTKLTGVPDLPPKWSLGYHQCKWSYYPESQVKEIAAKFRELDIPCDAIYLDIDYMDGFRCFTWDKEKFPDPKRMISELAADGFKTVVIIDPGIKVDPEYSVFNEGVENDYFCRRADGPFMKGKVWPDDCYFPDFTSSRVRKWWAELFEGLIDDGVRGVWNDMNEPALFEVESKTFPDDVRHDYDGHACSHRKAHNIYGMQMARASNKGIKKFLRKEGKRQFLITRSSYSGGQRYSSGWTGDNVATWEHLSLANLQCQRMAVSGFSFIGSDVGGFTEHPTPELYIRWVQLATFHPFFRTHSSGDHGVQEPWTFGEDALRISRNFIKLRYKLLPYMYTTFYQYVHDAMPMLRPLAFVDQGNPETVNRVDEFLCGDHILICPIIEPNSKGRYVYLPKGNWYNYWTNEFLEGGKETWIDCQLDTIPVLMKSGAVIPFSPVMNYVGEKKIDELELKVYHGNGEVISSLYEDGGDGYEYRDGMFNMKRFKTVTTNKSFTLFQERKGHYNTDYSHYKLRIIGIDFEVSKVILNGVDAGVGVISNIDGALEIKVDKKFWEIALS